MALVIALCLGNVWTSFLRSGIPLSFQGRVERIEVRREKHPGIDEVHLVRIGSRLAHLDRSFERALDVGDHVSKRPWARSVLVNGLALRIVPSRDFYGMLFVMSIVIGIAWLATARTRLLSRRRED